MNDCLSKAQPVKSRGQPLSCWDPQLLNQKFFWIPCFKLHFPSVLTRFHIQGVFINGQVHGVICSVAEIFQDHVHSVGDIPRHRFGKFHSTVHHNAAISEVQDFQILESSEI